MAITFDELEEFDMINYQLLALNAKTVIKNYLEAKYQGKSFSPLIYRVLIKARHFIAQIQAGALKGSPESYSENLLPTLEATWIAEYAKRAWEEYLDGDKKIPLEERVNSYIAAINAVEKHVDLNKDNVETRTTKENLERVLKFFDCIYKIFDKDLDEMTVRMRT